VILAIWLDLAKWQAVGVAVAAIALPIIWQVIRPLPFEFTNHGDYYKLAFSDGGYARAVAALNNGEIDDDEDDKFRSREQGVDPNA
jgi:hypothetical protein